MDKKHILTLLFALITLTALGQESKYFQDNDLTINGVYYYPEQWDESQWDRDFKKIAEVGFEFVHMGEFAWAQLEPKEGTYDFKWLDKAVALADKYHLRCILCTSTATPPVWLTRKYPDILLTNQDGTRLDHGARQHASFTSPLYRTLSMKMIAELGRHYGQDTRVMGWQLDNEPAVQFDYSPVAETLFRQFLRKKYPTINELNKAWGTSFWSQTYSEFDEITLPKTEMMFMNPHEIMDYRRFAALQTVQFLDQQTDMLRKYISDNQFVTTNFIPNYDDGTIGQCKKLDFNSYTRYMVFGDRGGVGLKGYRVGDPLRIGFANDFFRPINGYYGVMELQPGQVNWGEVNTQPLPKSVRLWCWNVFAGGSDFLCTYRFRQPLAGMEQYHNGIVGPDGVTVSPGGEEFIQYMSELKSLRKEFKPKEQKPAEYLARKAAILYNYENAWNIDRQKQNKYWNTADHIAWYYGALKSFGAPVDVISEKADFSKYPFMIVPAYELVDDQLIQRWKDYANAGGHLILTCRTGHKDRYGRLFEMKFGGKMFDFIGGEMEFYDLLQATRPDKVRIGQKDYEWFSWGEVFKAYEGTEVWATYQGDFYTGKPAVLHRAYGKGTVTYVGVDTKTGEAEKEVLRKIYKLANVPVLDLPKGILVEYRNGLGIAMNYSDQDYVFPLSPKAQILIGENPMSPTDVLVWKEGGVQ
jgi:beta-galactosidase